MPYLKETLTGSDARFVCAHKPPFGPGFTDVERIDLVEVWASSVQDAGEDYCEFRAKDAAGQLVGTKRIGGY